MVLVMEIEPVLRRERFHHVPQNARLGADQPPRVAIEINPPRIEAARAHRAVGVQQNHQPQRAAGEHRLGGRMLGLSGEKLQQVEQHGGVRRLVAVHLRPRENSLRPGTKREQFNRPAFNRRVQRRAA